MTETLRLILVGLVPSLVVAMVTAFLTVRLSISQFHSQWWWERKAQAYSDILEHLSDLHYYFKAIWEEALQNPLPDHEARKRLQGIYDQAKTSIIKAIAIGGFVASQEASRALKHLLAELDKRDPDYLGFEDKSYVALDEAIEQIRGIAKADLGGR